MKKIINISVLIVLTVVFVFIYSDTASAHRVPENCLGSGLSINLYSSVQEVRAGETVSYSIDVFNGTGSGPIVCDASAIQVSIITPDNQPHPVTLSRIALAQSEKDHYDNIVTYTARSEDAKSGNILTTSASVIGNIHQNDTDSQGGGNQSVNVTLLPPVPVVTPPVTVPPVEPPVVVPTPTTPPSITYGSGPGYVPTPVVAVIPPVIIPVAPVAVPIFPKTGPGDEDDILQSMFAPKIKDLYMMNSRKSIAERLPEDMPVRIQIPSIKVDSTIERVGLTIDGKMAIPKGDGNAGWFDLGVVPGEEGNAVIDGHSGWINGKRAVFDTIHNLKKGDTISVENGKGDTSVFIVREIRTYGKNDDATDVFISNDGKAHLNLITCEKVEDGTNSASQKRIVVFADLKDSK